jgi:hypothetical protein
MPKTSPTRLMDRRRGTRTHKEGQLLLGCGRYGLDLLMDNGTVDFVQIGNKRLPTVHGIEKALGKPIAELERWNDAAAATAGIT